MLLAYKLEWAQSDARLGDRRGENGTFVPPLEPRRILLGQDALAYGIRGHAFACADAA